MYIINDSNIFNPFKCECTQILIENRGSFYPAKCEEYSFSSSGSSKRNLNIKI